MSLYDWPPARSGDDDGDDPGGRVAFFRRRRSELDSEAARRSARRAPQPAPGVLRAPASGRANLWQSLGPDTVIDGQVIGSTRITGRINMLAVHPDGERLYAASANGGVWHSADGGRHWKSLGGFAATPAPASVNRPAQRNACGAIAVDWNAAGGEVVYVGTGETSHTANAQPGRSLGGIGVLRAIDPAASSADDPWTREADNLLGHGVYRIALQPGGTGVVAATTVGLFERPLTASADTDWVKSGFAPFDSLGVRCTDVLWTRGDGTRPERLWVWVQDGDRAGLWVRAAGASSFDRIIDARRTASASIDEAPRQRAVLAIADPAASPDQVYLFVDHGKDDGSGLPRLFRIACASAARPTATRVAAVPDVLGSQGFYDIALAVHPTLKDRVVIGGSTFEATAPGGRRLVNTAGTKDAAIVYADVAAGVSGALLFGHPAASKMIGAGVHADVHDLVYSKAGARLWAACDGGVYRSDRPTDLAGFAAMNDGISVVESNYVTNHPVCDGLVVTGLQDNGIIRRRSGAVWMHEGDGDGGGVAFDPTQPQRYVRQFTRAGWGSSDGTFSLPVPAAENSAEHCAFYSTPAAITKLRPGAPVGQRTITQVIVGTSRLWYTEDFGTTWVTLHSGTAPPAGDLTQDKFGERITVCRWQTSEVAWALGEGRVRRYARSAATDNAAGPGTWTSETVLQKGVKNKKDATSADGPVRDAAVWTDIAVNLDAPGTQRGTRGALYLGTTGKHDNEDVDTLYWFDGTDKWHPTRLRRNGVPAPVTAIVCDPAFPHEVYVGTTIGVWKGTRNLATPAAPAWAWTSRVNGLPEAAVEDLAIHTRGGLRLLRAAIAARGVWELRLDSADVADLAYLRAHEHDLRHTLPSSPLSDDGVNARSWHASPDLHARRAPLTCPAPPTLPWTRGGGGIEAEKLRRYQSALRERLGDPRIRPTGNFDDWFNEVLRSLGAPQVGTTVRLDKTFWEASMQLPWAVAEPWSSGARPTHADLVEFSAALPERPLPTQASCELPRDASRIDVLVQARCLAPIDGANVRVALLQWTDPQTPPSSRWDDITTWPGGNVPWTAAVNEVLNSAGGTTGQAFGAGWRLAGARQTLAGRTIDPTHPGIATFDIDLSLVPDDRLVLFVALIRFGADAAVPADTLENLVLGQSNVAARSVRIHGPSVQVSAARSPFASVPNAQELQPSAAQNARLATALSAVRGTLDAARADMLDKAAILVAKLTPNGPMDYAGVNETGMYFSASLLKSVLLYASFELVAQVNALAPAISATTARRFFDAVEREFMPTIERSVRRIKPGAWRRTSFRQALTASSAGTNQWRVALSAAHAQDLRRVFAEQNQNTTPRDAVHRLGYCYVNRALETAGFLDTDTDTGLWWATDYGGWSDFNVPVVTTSRARVPKRGSSSAAMTALAMASLWSRIHRRQLIDAAASDAMRAIIAQGGAWFSTLDAPVRAAFSFTDIGAKVGHSASGSAFVGSVQSEAAFLRRTGDGAEFIAVWQNVPDELDSEPIYRVLDPMIRDWP